MLAEWNYEEGLWFVVLDGAGIQERECRNERHGGIYQPQHGKEPLEVSSAEALKVSGLNDKVCVQVINRTFLRSC